jgi:hypothetical protein
MPGATSGRVTSRNVCAGLAPRVGRAQRPLDGEHQERHRDERLRDHDGAGRERKVDADLGEPLPDDAAPPEQQQQRDATDDRRKHERDRDRGAQQPPRHDRPVHRVRQQHGDRDAEHEAGDGRDGGGAERQE